MKHYVLLRGAVREALASLQTVVGCTESSFPIDLTRVFSTLELDAVHFQLSSTQLDPIPDAFNVTRSIQVLSTKIEWQGIDLRRSIPVYSGPSHTSDSGPQPSPYYTELVIRIIPGLFRVFALASAIGARCTLELIQWQGMVAAASGSRQGRSSGPDQLSPTQLEMSSIVNELSVSQGSPTQSHTSPSRNTKNANDIFPVLLVLHYE